MSFPYVVKGNPRLIPPFTTHGGRRAGMVSIFCGYPLTPLDKAQPNCAAYLTGLTTIRPPEAGRYNKTCDKSHRYNPRV